MFDGALARSIFRMKLRWRRGYLSLHDEARDRRDVLHDRTCNQLLTLLLTLSIGGKAIDTDHTTALADNGSYFESTCQLQTSKLLRRTHVSEIRIICHME